MRMEMLARAREETDALFRLVRPDSFYERPIPERHRIIFYLGHLEAFDWNLFGRTLDHPPVDATLDRLFAFGIDPPPGQLPQDQPSDWPSVGEVERYCRRVRDAVDAVEIPEELTHVAVEHRLMHAETLAYILHQLAYERKTGAGTWEPGAGESGADASTIEVSAGSARLGMNRGERKTGVGTWEPGVGGSGADTSTIEISAGSARLGMNRGERKTGVGTWEPGAGGSGADASTIEVSAGSARLGMNRGEGFGWDNEFDAHVVGVPAFSIARHKVTNGEYLEFVRQGAAAPFFWVCRGGTWFYRGMWNEIPLPLDWPVYVTHDEASAFAKWRGMRLPTEAEWHRAACGSTVSRNVDFASWDPIPVSEGDAGIEQMIGNGWEWTSTVFAPFPGFRPFPFYPNYSEPFFDGRHFVLKGASPRTARCFLRASFRNWFRPSYPYLYATFRLVES